MNILKWEVGYSVVIMVDMIEWSVEYKLNL